MKTLVLHGSPRRGGNSDTLAKSLEDGMREGGAIHFWHFYANELDIGHCQGCMTCQDSDDNSCAIQDDMQEIYSAFIEADTVVFATPMFWGYMTSQLKTILDRMEALAVGPEEWWRGKTFVAVITYWYHYESTVKFFERICPTFGVEFHPVIYCSHEEGQEGDVHVSQRPEKLEEAYGLGLRLAKANSKSAEL